jgi:hypothetical protein
MLEILRRRGELRLDEGLALVLNINRSSPLPVRYIVSTIQIVLHDECAAMLKVQACYYPGLWNCKRLWTGSFQSDIPILRLTCSSEKAVNGLAFSSFLLSFRPFVGALVTAPRICMRL